MNLKIRRPKTSKLGTFHSIGRFSKTEGQTMKKILGAAGAAAAAVACIAVGTAGTAAADPELNGTYTLTVDDTQATTTKFAMSDPKVVTTTWVITSCGADCAHVTTPDNPKGGGDLHLVNGRWELTSEFTLPMPSCPPGPTVTNVTSLDPATLQGTQVNTNHCLDNVITAPANLTPA
jgi:hypothetical protein